MGKSFFSFLLEGERAQESGLYEKNCIDELSNYLGGCMGKKKFLLFEGEGCKSAKCILKMY
jgi:hypothetical protein